MIERRSCREGRNPALSVRSDLTKFVTHTRTLENDYTQKIRWVFFFLQGIIDHSA
jgi:hypothetical protein